MSVEVSCHRGYVDEVTAEPIRARAWGRYPRRMRAAVRGGAVSPIDGVLLCPPDVTA